MAYTPGPRNHQGSQRRNQDDSKKHLPKPEITLTLDDPIVSGNRFEVLATVRGVFGARPLLGKVQFLRGGETRMTEDGPLLDLSGGIATRAITFPGTATRGVIEVRLDGYPLVSERKSISLPGEPVKPRPATPAEVKVYVSRVGNDIHHLVRVFDKNGRGVPNVKLIILTNGDSQLVETNKVGEFVANFTIATPEFEFAIFVSGFSEAADAKIFERTYRPKTVRRDQTPRWRNLSIIFAPRFNNAICGMLWGLTLLLFVAGIVSLFVYGFPDSLGIKALGHGGSAITEYYSASTRYFTGDTQALTTPTWNPFWTIALSFLLSLLVSLIYTPIAFLDEFQEVMDRVTERYEERPVTIRLAREALPAPPPVKPSTSTPTTQDTPALTTTQGIKLPAWLQRFTGRFSADFLSEVAWEFLVNRLNRLLLRRA